MASSAAQNIPGSAHIHALQQKAHHKSAAEKSPQYDSFSDLLAETSRLEPPKQAQPGDRTARADNPATAEADTTTDTTANASETSGEAHDAATSERATETAPQVPGDEPANDNDSMAEATFGHAANETQARLKQAPAQPGEATSGAKDVAKPATAEAGPADAAHDTLADADASQFEKAVQDTRAEPLRATDAVQARPVDMKPAAEITALTLATGTAITHATQGTDRVAIATQAATQQAEAPLPAPNVNQFAIEVAARSQAGAKQFDIRLDPPELGRVDVRLSIDATGKAEAHLTAEAQQTLDLLQKDAPTLARALRDAGLNLAQDGLNFSLKNQQQQAGNDNGRHAGGQHAAAPRAIHDAAEVSAHLRHGRGLLDIRV